MATPIRSALTDHSPLDGGGTTINGADVDANPYVEADVLDGTTGTTLNSAASPLMNFTVLPYTLDHKVGRIKVYNNTGFSIADGSLLYVSAYNSATALYEVTKAVATTATADSTGAGTLYAELVADGAIGSSAAGYATIYRVLTDQVTTGLTPGRPIYLSSTAGGWSGTLLAADYRCQIVGKVVVASATVGRIEFTLPGSIVPWSIADQI